MGKYFMSTQNIFTSRRRVKIWRESKISFPYCTTSVISDLLLLWNFSQPVTIQFSLILLATRVLLGPFNNKRTIWENTERSRDAEIFKKKYQSCNKYIYIYNTYSTSQSTIWENILRARKIFSRAKGEWKCGVRVKYHSHIVRRVW